jgi:hypothetical protein
MIRIFLFASMLSLVGCAAMQKDFQDKTCHYDGAFEKGVNDAQQNESMNAERTAYQCPEATKADVRTGYRDGYMGVKSKPAGININIGGASSAQQQCLDAYGKRECGYGCKEAYGKLKCAKIPGNTCIEAYGNITCGSNCREEFGKIKCDSYE